MDRQCSSCGGFCRKSGCERENVKPEPEPEPFGIFQYDLRLDAWVQNRDTLKGVPFYTAPPKKKWVGLTDEELAPIYAEYKSPRNIYLAIESALRKKNT